MGSLTEIPNGKSSPDANQSETDQANSPGGIEEVQAAIAVAEKGSANTDSPTSNARVGKKPHFTVKENKFLRGYVKDVIPGHKTKRALAMEIYDTDDPQHASVIASTNLSKVKFKDALRDALDKAGITSDTIAETLQDAMTATKTASLQGVVFPSDEPDHSVRVAAARAAATILQDEDDSDKPGAINFNIFQQNNTQQNFIKKVD